MTDRGAAVFIRDAEGRVLLIHEAYGRHRWGLPGGLQEPGEDIRGTAIREAKEETGLDVELGDPIGDYSILDAGGSVLITASVFTAEIVGGELRPNQGEIEEVGWFDPQEIPEPRTDTGPSAIADGVSGARGVKRSVVTRNR